MERIAGGHTITTCIQDRTVIEDTESSAVLLLLFAYPFDQQLLSPWVIAAAAPYVVSMSQDLKDSRYRRLDVLRIYGFNLILLAVNLAGTLKSIQQGLSNQKIPFARTPKAANRTSSPWPYVLAPYMIISLSALILCLDVRGQNWGNAVFAGVNAFTCSWALVACIGIWPSLQDLALGVGGWFFVPEEPDAIHKQAGATPSSPREDWQAWLDFGDLRRSPVVRSGPVMACAHRGTAHSHGPARLLLSHDDTQGAVLDGRRAGHLRGRAGGPGPALPRPRRSPRPLHHLVGGQCPRFTLVRGPPPGQGPPSDSSSVAQLCSQSARPLPHSRSGSVPRERTAMGCRC